MYICGWVGLLRQHLPLLTVALIGAGRRKLLHCVVRTAAAASRPGCIQLLHNFGILGCPPPQLQVARRQRRAAAQHGRWRATIGRTGPSAAASGHGARRVRRHGAAGGGPRSQSSAGAVGGH